MITKVLDSLDSDTLHTDSIQYRDAVNLYYVACSRAKKSLINAHALNVYTQRV